MVKEKTPKKKEEKKEPLKDEDYLDLSNLAVETKHEDPRIKEEIINIERVNKHPQEQMGDPKGYSTSSPSSVAKKSGYTGMPESNQKHTPVDANISQPPKSRKSFFIIGIIVLILIIGNTSFFAYTFYQKDFNTPINIQPANVNVNPLNNYTIVNDIKISLSDELYEKIANETIFQVKKQLNSS